MGTIKVAARNIEPGDEIVLGEDGQTAKVNRVLNTGSSVQISTPVSSHTRAPDETVELVVGSDD